MRISRRFPRSAGLAAALLLMSAGAALPGLHPSTAHAATGSGAPLATRGQAESHQQRLRDTISALRGKVKYVFVLYQENRSFDSYFATFPGANGIYSKPASQTPGYYQAITNTDGTTSTIQPFRIGPSYYAADTDDPDHSHASTDLKMDVVGGVPLMDKFAQTEERRFSPTGAPSLLAKQYGELTMAHEDCDTVPLLWNYAKNFTLMDNIYEQMTGPSTPGNLSILGAQAGQTQQVLHPAQGYGGTANGNGGPGLPVLNDTCPLWGSRTDPYSATTGTPYNSVTECHNTGSSPTGGPNPTTSSFQTNLTYAALPVSFEGPNALTTFTNNNDLGGGSDIADLTNSVVSGTATVSDTSAVAATDSQVVPWGWYEEGYGANDPATANGGNAPYASYIVHHNGPQYFGYIMNNPIEHRHLHSLTDFFGDVQGDKLPTAGGAYYVKGGYQNIQGLKPTDPDPTVQKNFIGDDDHPAYSDAQISEALVAREVDAIARSPYWSQSAIIITYDDSEGDYDHAQPPIQNNGPASTSFIADGPRVPFILISPYSKQGVVSTPGDHGSVVKFIDAVFGLTPLATLPAEYQARQTARTVGISGTGSATQANYGPDDALTPGITDLVDAFDPAKLNGSVAPLPATLAEVPAGFTLFPTQEGQGCREVGITPVQPLAGESNVAPTDFNPRPSTNPGMFVPVGGGGGNATPELGSGELLATSLVPVALLLLYQRRRRTRRASDRTNSARV